MRVRTLFAVALVCGALVAVAGRVGDRCRTLLAHAPLAALMGGFTVVSLWVDLAPGRGLISSS